MLVIQHKVVHEYVSRPRYLDGYTHPTLHVDPAITCSQEPHVLATKIHELPKHLVSSL